LKLMDGLCAAISGNKFDDFIKEFYQLRGKSVPTVA